MRKIKNYILLILLGGISVYGQQGEFAKTRQRPPVPQRPRPKPKPKTPAPQAPTPPVTQNPLAAPQQEELPTGKVGINTAKPKQNLDVEGTIAVKTLPIKQNGAIPLALANDDQQVISAVDETGDTKPFRIIRYKLRLTTASQDWIAGIDLGIDSKNYTAFIMSSSLVDESEIDSNGHPSSVFLGLLGIEQQQGYGQELFVGEQLKRSSMQIVTPKGPDVTVYGSTNYTGRIGIGAKQIYLYPNTQTNKWMLYADYPVSKGLNFNYENKEMGKINYPATAGHSGKALKYDSNYTWYVSVLVVKNEWVGKIDNDIILKDNSDTTPKVTPSVLP